MYNGCLISFSLSLRQPILEYGTILSMIFSCQTAFSSLHCGIRRLERKDNIVSVKENEWIWVIIIILKDVCIAIGRPCIARIFQTQYQCGVTSIQLTLDQTNIFFMPKGTMLECPRSSFIYRYDNGSLVRNTFWRKEKGKKGGDLRFFGVSRLSWLGRSLLSSCWIAAPIHWKSSDSILNVPYTRSSSHGNTSTLHPPPPLKRNPNKTARKVPLLKSFQNQ